MDIFNRFAANKDLEENGKKIDLGEGAYILVARSGNVAYKRLLAKLYEAHKHELDQKGPEAEARSDKIMLEVISKTVLVGFGGLKYKGRDMEYSVANARTMLEGSEEANMRDFKDLVVKHSENFNNFRMIQEESDLKNSARTSSGH